ncbi:MAG: hypothetical protein Q7S87_09710 [Agitococcus sp.]|nr:hypothetical protein [Agitococcus sp.]MDO9179237.1 hypothetical protein [Agitococcus sp.]
MSLKIQKKDGPLFAADALQLARALQKRPKQKIILAGQLLTCSFEEIRSKDGLIPIPSRKVIAGIFAKKGSSAKLNLALDKEAALALIKERVKPMYAIDALLHYGQKLNRVEEAFVVCAVESSTNTMVSVLQFKKGILVSYAENILSSPATHTYDADLHALLDRLRASSSQAVFHWCSPLTVPRTHVFINGSPAVWSLAAAQTLSVSGRPSLIAQFGVPAFVLVGTVAGFVGAIYPPYQEYTLAANALVKENATLGEYTFASERLAMLEARKKFFSRTDIGADKLSQLESVLAACSRQAGLVVVAAQLIVTPGKDSRVSENIPKSDYNPDFEITVEVAKNTDMLILEQSEPLLRALSLELGISLRLAVIDGFKERSIVGGLNAGTRTYRIQGAFSHGV